ncbi:MAG TPA: ArdC family protein [Propionicimonas sp.]
MHRDLATKLATFDDRDVWQQWLRFARTFHQYSFSNTCLILMAKPDATLVAGYRAWQAKGHQVRRGEQAIKVFAPVTRNAPLEDANGKPILDANGRPATRRQVVGVKLTSVFDASQVDPPPQIQRPQPLLLTGEAPGGLWDSLIELLASEGFTVTRGDCGGANGLTDFTTNEVRVRADVDAAQSVKSLCHEAAHVLTMDAADRAAYGSRQCRGVAEVVAESVAYLVTQAHGLDSRQYTFNYVAGWALEAAGRKAQTRSIDQVVRETGDRVISATHRILAHTQPAIEQTTPTRPAHAVSVSSGFAYWETVAAQRHPRTEAANPVARSRDRGTPRPNR